jgi:hypothetical protein
MASWGRGALRLGGLANLVVATGPSLVWALGPPGVSGSDYSLVVYHTAEPIARKITPLSHSWYATSTDTPDARAVTDQKAMRMMPVATSVAANARGQPNRSLKNSIPITAATMTLVSRSAATSASGARTWAHNTAP